MKAGNFPEDTEKNAIVHLRPTVSVDTFQHLAHKELLKCRAGLGLVESYSSSSPKIEVLYLLYRNEIVNNKIPNARKRMVFEMVESSLTS